MTHEEKQTLSQILRKMEEDRETRNGLIADVKDMKICLMGKPDDPEDLGLQGSVLENTHFRKSVIKFFWVLIPAFLGSMIFFVKESLLKLKG